MVKKKDEIAVIPNSEVTVIPSKEELQVGMRKTLKELDDKLAELSVPVDKPWKTSSVNYFIDGYNFTIAASANVTDMNYLIKALVAVRKCIEDQKKITKEFKLTHKPCLVGGYDAVTLEEELSRRIKIQTNTTQLADVKAAKAKLEAFLSEDDRLIKTLSEVEALLK